MTVPVLTGAQKSHLRSLGQTMDCGIAIGKEGVSRTVIIELKKLFGHQELVKVKVHAERDERPKLCAQIEAETGSIEVGAVGKTALFYRQHPDPAVRTITLPESKTKSAV
ncbi:MAG: YhbY family RNA-binding protein [Opitutaceae bacterium]|nr:YhbY family RNA-binding protein [Opitutaceae bacterium]